MKSSHPERGNEHVQNVSFVARFGGLGGQFFSFSFLSFPPCYMAFIQLYISTKVNYQVEEGFILLYTCGREANERLCRAIKNDF